MVAMLRKIRPIAKLMIGLYLALILTSFVIGASDGAVLVANHGISSDGILPILGQTVAYMLVVLFIVWIAFDSKKTLTEIQRRREKRRMEDTHDG